MRTGTARSHTPDRSPARTDRPSRSPERAPTARTGAASIGRAYEARGTTEGLDGASVRAAKDTFVAELCARLVKAELVPAGTTLASPVGANVLARVSAAPALVSTPPASFGALLAAIVGDVDTDGRFDVDALALSRALPGAGASRILDALTAKLDGETLDALVTKIGFDPARRAELPTDVLTLTPPVELGLAGHTELDRWRQQLSLRADAILTDDGTRPGELDAADHVEVVSPSTGAVVAVPFSAVSPQLVEAFRFNLLTARAAELFVERGTMMRFIDPERGDQVNEAFWSVATASTPVGRQTSWELRPGQSAAAAIDDCFGANAQTYATECAHGRTLVRLKGLLDYDRAAEGSDAAGDYAFDARFAATELDRAAATKWLEGFAAARASGATWAEYSAESPPPKIQCTIEISRHWVFGAEESELTPLAQLGGGAAAGTSGYFHNYGVSIQGVKEGWVGENVIDVGYRDGTHRWFGHPIGIRTESEWKQDLSRAQVTSMSEYSEYLIPRVTEDSWKATKVELDRVRGQLRTLERQSDPDEDQLRALREQLGRLETHHAVRAVFGDELTAKGPTTVPALLSALAARPDDTKTWSKLLDALTPAGVGRLARAFPKIEHDAREAALEALGLEGEESKEAHALAVLRSALAPKGVVRGALVDEVRTMATERRVIADLQPGGRLASRADLQRWLRSPEFPDWYRAETGRDYSGARAVSNLELPELAALVELVLPATKGRLTVHAETNGGDDLLSHQMAELLKTGRAPEARYTPEPSVAPGAR